MRFLACLLIPLGLLGLACSDGGKDGPVIEVDVNAKHLCGFGVINGTEDRCEDHADCPGGNMFCWDSGETHHTRGFCRECETDGECPPGLLCDHNWCHTPCTQTDPDCNAHDGWYCTAGFCRKPHHEQMTVSFCNAGNKDLEVYLDQTRLYGPTEACVFSRWEWMPAGQDTVVLAPDECGLYLNVKFTPLDVGMHRGFMEVHSNSIEYNPLLVLLCGEAVNAICQAAVDGDCPDCGSCIDEDFTQMLSQHSEPDCSDFN